MVLEHYSQRRHVVSESSDRLINHPDESGIVGHKEGDTDGLLEESGRSLVCTIRRWDLNRLQYVESKGCVRGIECGSDVARRDQYAVNLVDEYGAPLRRVNNRPACKQNDIPSY